MIKYAQITNEKTKECSVGLGTNEAFYKSIGMTEMDIEQAYDGRWFVKGYAQKKVTTHEELVEFLYQEKCKVAYNGVTIVIGENKYLFETTQDSITMCNSMALALNAQPDEYLLYWKVWKDSSPIMLGITKSQFNEIFSFGMLMINQAFSIEGNLNAEQEAFTEDQLADEEFIAKFKNKAVNDFNGISTEFIIE